MNDTREGQASLRMRRREFGVLATGALAGGLARAQQGPYKPEYKLSTIAARPVSFGTVAEDWADSVRERTKGRINMKLYPNSVLVGGDQTREFSALRQGVIDMAVGPGISWSAQVKEFNVFSLPFLIPSNKVADQVVASPVGEMIFARLRQLGVEPLGWGDSSFRIVANSRRPIRRPEDLKGLKLRTIGSPLFTDFYAALGANPTQMSLTDMMAALPTGALDGVDNSVEGYQLLKLAAMKQKYLTFLNYCWEPAVLSVNREVFNSWSREDQAIVRQAAVEQGQKMREIKRKGISDHDDSTLRELAKAGTEVVQLTPEELQAFRQATRHVYVKWSSMLDPALVRAAEAAAIGKA
jgi:tripartite ATP-independent transporter DctP family solute receptor